jgi:two-component system sensor histidine kinase KdpD
LGDVVAAAAAASGLPRAQLVVEFGPRAGEVVVGDARLQRILGNLLENAHRHGAGAPVGLTVTCRPGWVELALRQASTCCGAVIDHLHRSAPPVDLTGLGLWSVQRQARELGGLVDAEDDGATLTLRVLLPDH